jgi:hypothetical protein
MKKQSEKRSLQNRSSQRTFRQKMAQQKMELEKKANDYDSIMTEYSVYKNWAQQTIGQLSDEQTMMIQEKEKMIHLMDKLRADNERLRDKLKAESERTNNERLLRINPTFIVKGISTFVRPPPTAPTVFRSKAKTLTANPKTSSSEYMPLLPPPSNDIQPSQMAPYHIMFSYGDSVGSHSI